MDSQVHMLSNVTDYQSGWGTANVGTVVDYQSNSTASTYTGSVVDYTSKGFFWA